MNKDEMMDIFYINAVGSIGSTLLYREPKISATLWHGLLSSVRPISRI